MLAMLFFGFRLACVAPDDTTIRLATCKYAEELSGPAICKLGDKDHGYILYQTDCNAPWELLDVWSENHPPIHLR